jgi:hypothetical protein
MVSATIIAECKGYLIAAKKRNSHRGSRTGRCYVRARISRGCNPELRIGKDTALLD